MRIKEQPYYRPFGKEVEVFTHCYKNKLAVLLKGPTGTGKTRFVEYMAHQLDLPLITVACHEETSAIDLTGRYILKGAETIWQDGPLTTAVRNGCIIYLDEIAEARPDVIVAIHSLTDHRRHLFLDKLPEEVAAADSFLLVASFNPGYQRGFKELKPSTRQRFVSLAFNYPDEKVEQEIVENESGVEQADAKRLVNIANKIRNLNELGLMETVSTRLVVDSAKLIQSGLPKRLSVEVGMIQPLTDDDETLTALKDLSDLMI
ncbi:MAG: CbbQ/NirQ/NorQ/GpvN family protein [Saprospiraceae bacterium]|nr:CbbQ/NirQ/NorQ/GpvN family protein [Saprospiraceae bacterium]MCF8252088.1 CbbQ/NirQ/NorQ/GpvN family protein [Saprospiraceae bacterium]MCF8283208.1 CbbQ/NirQ/NorQ/GpvN family protein [Bacteroidales bacterium]MCF8313731.1 CbbQ/NirQ/NorQ/GpvN family protein [Saprospiraceae bacterium]MCF8442461.1 CbbQ/NirQ/NorQ/GpvN family protein [Saprospiraceae bacterium]